MFIWYNGNPRGNYFAGDCVIRAISIVTGDSWDDIYDELCNKGKYIGDWGNNNGVWDSYLRQRGFKRYICPNDCPYCYPHHIHIHTGLLHTHTTKNYLTQKCP